MQILSTHNHLCLFAFAIRFKAFDKSCEIKRLQATDPFADPMLRRSIDIAGLSPQL